MELIPLRAELFPSTTKLIPLGAELFPVITELSTLRAELFTSGREQILLGAIFLNNGANSPPSERITYIQRGGGGESWEVAKRK